jgi:hypothetical protein
MIGMKRAANWLDRATRTLGSVTGMYMNFGWAWYMWREVHEYFMSPFGVFLWGTGLFCNLIYPYAFAAISKREKVLPDGRRISGNEKGYRRDGFTVARIKKS